MVGWHHRLDGHGCGWTPGVGDVEERNSAWLSSSSRDDRTLVDLCLESACFSVLWGSKFTADGDCGHEIKRRLLLVRNAMTNLDSLLKSRDITLPTKVHPIKDMVFPRSKRLLISCLQSPSAVILEPKKIKSDTVSTVSPSICHEVMGPDAIILVF